MLVSEGPPLEIGDALHKVMEKVSLPDAEDLEMWAEAICTRSSGSWSTRRGRGHGPAVPGEPYREARDESGSYRREVPFTFTVRVATSPAAST